MSLIVSIRSNLTHLHGSQLLVLLSVHRNHFFLLNQQNKSFESKVKFRQDSNCCKKVFEAVKKSHPRN